MNLDILSKGNFRNKKFQIPIEVDPGRTAQSDLSLHGCIFSVEKLTWKYGVDSSDKRVASNSYGWPKTPLRVTINPIVRDEVTPPEAIKPAAVFRNLITINVLNPSEIPVTLNLTMEGTLIEVFPGCDISNLEVIGYSMLDDSHKGMLALNHLAREGPVAIETSGHKSLETTSGHLALPVSLDKEEQMSLLIGDMIRAKTSLPVAEVENLAELLISKGWRREPR